jgi:Ca2+-binding EF-hand superfamily protein
MENNNGVPFKVLKPACIDALKRIFKLCDMNKDGVLDDSELNEFQVGMLPCNQLRSDILK